MKLSFALVASALLFGVTSASPLIADRDNRNGPVPVIASVSTTYNTPTSVSAEPSTTQEITPTTTQAEDSLPTTTEQVSSASSTRTRGPRPRTSTMIASSSSAVESSYSSAQPSASPAARPAVDLDNYFIGANSYYLHTIRDGDRYAILDAMQSVGMKTVRIFLTAVMQNNKGSDNPQVNDVEPQVGVYDDTMLKMVDQLMVDVQSRGMKLVIALGDRYALGFWDTNDYARKFGIVQGGSGAQRIANAANFYLDTDAKVAYDKRIDYILNHRNSLMGDKKWAELDEVIYSLEPQNEPMGHMDLVDDLWTCHRAGRIRENLPSNTPILVGTGGGITLQTSMADWAYNCDAIDIVSVHDYGTDSYSSINALKTGIARGRDVGKRVEFQEWGASGSNKANVIKAFVNGMRDAGISNMVWQIVKPGKSANDFEIWTDEGAWGAFQSAGLKKKRTIDYNVLPSYPQNETQVAPMARRERQMVKRVASVHKFARRKF